MRIGLTLLGLLLIISCKQKEKPKEKVVQGPPNIIFIMSDDHAYQAISAYDHELGKLAPTPNIDRIAKNGAIFQNNFCTNSICGPSRAVILTGKHSHINGFRMNGERFDNSQPTLPKHLQKLGYETAIVGKWHLHGKPTGFDYWDILNDQGNYYNPEFIQGEDTTVVEGYATDLITDKSLEWLQKRKDGQKPFYLMVHHKAPHRNWMPALRHLNVYDSITFPLPDTYFPEFEDQTAAAQQQQTIYRDMYEGHDLKMSDGPGSTDLAHNPWTTDFERMTPEQRSIWDEAYLPKNNAFYEADLHGKELAEWKGQRYLHEYLATVKSVDEGIGRILDYLEETGLDENTLVVYTSDQGFYLGEHGWFDKRFIYEESMRMPLLMQLPGVIEPGTNIDALVQNLDFAPTFLDLAGGREYAANMQGESFRGLLEGAQDDFKDAVYYHYYDFPAFHMVKRQYGVRTDKYKLIHFYDDIDEWEFYDLEKDPKELHNAINDEEYKDIVTLMHKKLDSLQTHYKVTDKEFETTPKEKVDRTYKAFEKLRGTPIQ
ncbi:sulfatase [Muricauda oceani]|uniref:Sulfatase n=1 Tax=Flagellimonas oceani TaxID=2698672 RepID=A0A6G7J333_9FLAO|nr:sulfatase [Allomuricauda oceani]MBW8243975.1 sulfatase [Allomuricauda oceani]QII44954.1 sulfatase [Allomuricauda oceani]